MSAISFSSRLAGVGDKIGAGSRTILRLGRADFHTWSPFEERSEDQRTGHTALAVNLFLGLLLLSAIAASFAGSRAKFALERQMTAVANVRAGDLAREVERYRAIPYILSRDPEVLQAVISPDAGLRRRLGLKLQDISREANVGILYVRGFVGADAAPPTANAADCGRTVAYVFPGEPVTTPRTDRFFCNVLGPGKTEGFAVSRTGRGPGMFFARPIHLDGQRVGMVGTKAEFHDIEALWAKEGLAAFVTDSDGVVLLTSVAPWRFRTLESLSAAARAELNKTGRYGSASLAPLPINWETNADGLLAVDVPGAQPDKYLLTTAQIANAGWKLHVLTPAQEPLRTAKLSAGVIVLFSGLLLLNLMRAVQRGRIRRAVEAAQQVAIRDELERRVNQRTAELQAANKLLKNEMDERRRVARKVNSLREELVQANKLATLGQVTAGVAHEINQPVAAIRTYADSALVFLKRNQPPLVEENLHYIGELTEKISLITQELRSFSRRSTGSLVATDLTSAIDGALLLSGHRLTVQDIEVVRSGEFPGLTVFAEKMRLEQVLVNLIQNAMDAMEGSVRRQLSVIVEDRVAEVALHIQDTGEGLGEAAMKDLFMPFVTTKPNGLGLGLVISHEIITEFGGELTARNTGEGARFTFTLRKVLESSEC